MSLYDVFKEQIIIFTFQEEQETRWVFLNLAGLYWRINGNLVNGVECLRHAVRETPKEYLDLPLVNLASLLYKGGHIDDALQVALKALHINSTEVIFIGTCSHISTINIKS